MIPQTIPRDGWPTSVGGEAISGLSGVVTFTGSAVGVGVGILTGAWVGIGSGSISGASCNVVWITYNDH